MSRAPLFLAIVLLFSLTACASAGEATGGGSSAPRRNASDLATVRAMAGIVASPTASSTSLIPATVPPTGADATATTSPTGPQGDPGLVAVLLSPEDLGTKWTMSGNATEDPGTGHCTGPDVGEQFALQGDAVANYASSDQQWIFQRVLRVADADGPAAMQYLRDALACTDVLREDKGETIFWTFDDLDFTALGDEMVARKLTITYANPIYTPAQGNIIVVRRGGLIVYLYHIAFRINQMETEVIARRAVDKVGTFQPPAAMLSR
jgi:hypothetical protein